MTVDVAITDRPLDLGAETSALPTDPDVGAVVTFLGLCRGEEGRLAALELEHYAGMAEAEIGRIAAAVRERWPVEHVRVIHRTGVVPVGAPIVFVATASSHREAAFDGARYLMDFLKTDAPFWKREHLVDGTLGPWIAAADRDDAARSRWLAQH